MQKRGQNTESHIQLWQHTQVINGNRLTGTKHMPSRENRANIERNPYQPEPQELGKVAPALGLQESAGLEAIREKLEDVLSRAAAIKLNDSLQDRNRVEALQVVNDSYKRAQPGFFSFNAQILPSGGRSFTQVMELLRNLVRLVEASERYVDPSTSAPAAPAQELSELTPPTQPVGTKQSFRGYQFDSPSHISHAVDEVLDRAKQQTPPEPAAVARLRDALKYLKEQRIIPPDALQGTEPAAAPSLALLRHGMSWVWNTRGTRSWDPRLATGRNQSLFTAAPQYFNEIPEQRSRAKQELLDTCLRIRTAEDASRHPLNSGSSEGTRGLRLLRRDVAAEVTGTTPTEYTLQRWEALYRFLRATESRSSGR